MIDPNDPAFPTSLGDLKYPGIPVRLWLIGHAPPCPETFSASMRAAAQKVFGATESDHERCDALIHASWAIQWAESVLSVESEINEEPTKCE